MVESDHFVYLKRIENYKTPNQGELHEKGTKNWSCGADVYQCDCIGHRRL